MAGMAEGYRMSPARALGAAAVVAATALAGPGSIAAAAQETGGAQDPAVVVAERFLTSLQAGEWAAAAALVSEHVPAGRLGAAELETAWGQIRGQLGNVQSRTLHQVVTVQDTLKSVEYVARFAAQPMLVRVVVAPSQKVAGFWLGAPPEGLETSRDVAPSSDARTPASPAAQTSQQAADPSYADPSRFREEDVETGAEGWRVGGTLTIPTSPGRHPVVVLVHGSGPHDRDETIGPNRPFRDLARGLATHGVAVLRYDKRTKVHGMRMTSVSVDAEVIDDALAALQLVRTRPELDPARVFLLGHSLGGQLGPAIALRDGNLAGLVLLAAPARDLATLMLAQFEHLSGLPQNQAPAAQQQIRDFVAQVRRLASGEAQDTENILGAPVSYFRELSAHDPIATTRRIDTPLLVLQGERDYQVTMDDFRLWQDALRTRAHTHTRSFAGLNHLFMHGEGTPNPVEYMQPAHVAKDVIDAIAAWIRDSPAARR